MEVQIVRAHRSAAYHAPNKISLSPLTQYGDPHRPSSPLYTNYWEAFPQEFIQKYTIREILFSTLPNNNEVDRKYDASPITANSKVVPQLTNRE